MHMYIYVCMYVCMDKDNTLPTSPERTYALNSPDGKNIFMYVIMYIYAYVYICMYVCMDKDNTLPTSPERTYSLNSPDGNLKKLIHNLYIQICKHRIVV
jgi:hypothetical protein